MCIIWARIKENSLRTMEEVFFQSLCKSMNILIYLRLLHLLLCFKELSLLFHEGTWDLAIQDVYGWQKLCERYNQSGLVCQLDRGHMYTAILQPSESRIILHMSNLCSLYSWNLWIFLLILFILFFLFYSNSN